MPCAANNISDHTVVAWIEVNRCFRYVSMPSHVLLYTFECAQCFPGFEEFGQHRASLDTTGQCFLLDWAAHFFLFFAQHQSHCKVDSSQGWVAANSFFLFSCMWVNYFPLPWTYISTDFHAIAQIVRFHVFVTNHYISITLFPLFMFDLSASDERIYAFCKEVSSRADPAASWEG